jgi:16S rRNA (cytosine967-C5)-methyltransferase
LTPAARIKAAIEVLDRIASEAAPADGVLKAWGRDHRFAGSGDRRAIADRVYRALRGQAKAAHRFEAWSGRGLVLQSLAEEGLGGAEVEALFSAGGHGPEPLSEAERSALRETPAYPDAVRAGVPAFVAEALKAGFGDAWLDEAEALTQARAPVDLRVNALRGDVEAAIRLMAVDEFKPERAPWSAWGLRLPAELSRDVQQSRAWKTGWIEVQDEASQIAAALAGPKPGQTVVDYCAGAGGKTLALAALMGGRGRLVACDIHMKRLANLPERLQRSGARAEARRIGLQGQGMDDLAAQADLVFVDAPCSGSGTWRRHPEGAFRLTPEGVARMAALQAGILDRASALVKPGGGLAYATCSVLPAENAEIAAGFAAAHPEFAPVAIARAAETPALTDPARARLAALSDGGHTLQLTPRSSGTDGFFLALFERTA